MSMESPLKFLACVALVLAIGLELFPVGCKRRDPPPATVKKAPLQIDIVPGLGSGQTTTIQAYLTQRFQGQATIPDFGLGNAWMIDTASFVRASAPQRRVDIGHSFGCHRLIIDAGLLSAVRTPAPIPSQPAKLGIFIDPVSFKPGVRTLDTTGLYERVIVYYRSKPDIEIQANIIGPNVEIRHYNGRHNDIHSPELCASIGDDIAAVR